MQQLRNTGYEVETTEQEKKREKEKTIKNVEDVWKSGSGSGREITWLYLALVRAAGLEAYPVLVSRRNEYFFTPQMMDPHRLDDNVVLVKLNGKDTLLRSRNGLHAFWDFAVAGNGRERFAPG